AAFARALLRRAGDARFPDALEAADELAPTSECGLAADIWHERLKANHAAARPLLEAMGQEGITIDFPRASLLPKVEAHFAGLGHPALSVSANGRLEVVSPPAAFIHPAIPEKWETLSD